jgi:hypothetical protein
MRSTIYDALRVAVFLAGSLCGTHPRLAVSSPNSKEEGAGRSDPNWSRVTVELPASSTLFPGGSAQSVANSQCLICHSADMVLLQPARTQIQWTETINKMRSAYGAPIGAGQVDALAAYLTRVVSGDSGAQSALVWQKEQAENSQHDCALPTRPRP